MGFSSVVIYCIDLSGSMCQTQEVQGRMQLKGVQLSNKLASFTDGSVQCVGDSCFFSPSMSSSYNNIRYMPGQRQDSTWVSRLQCVQAAVEAQLIALAVSEPETKVGLVTFSSDVTIIGDGIQEPVHVAGDKLVQVYLPMVCGELIRPAELVRSTHCSGQGVCCGEAYQREQGRAHSAHL